MQCQRCNGWVFKDADGRITCINCSAEYDSNGNLIRHHSQSTADYSRFRPPYRNNGNSRIYR